MSRNERRESRQNILMLRKRIRAKSKKGFEEHKRREPQFRRRTISRTPRRWRRSQRSTQRSSGTQVFQLTPISQPQTWHQRMCLKLEQISRHQDLCLSRNYAGDATQAERQEVLRRRARGRLISGGESRDGGSDVACKAGSRIGASPESGLARQLGLCLMNRHDDGLVQG
jgi:hypothetical protein